MNCRRCTYLGAYNTPHIAEIAIVAKSLFTLWKRLISGLFLIYPYFYRISCPLVERVGLAPAGDVFEVVNYTVE